MSNTQSLSIEEQLFLSNMLIKLKEPVTLSCFYRNWRGEIAERHLQPIEIWHGTTDWHPEPGLMLKAIDLDKKSERDFKVADFDLSTLKIC